MNIPKIFPDTLETVYLERIAIGNTPLAAFTKIMPKPQLIRPEILPDEIAQSYANRLVLVNGGETLEELMDRLSEFTTPQKNVPKVVFLAWAAGLELDEFVRLHTLTPFQRAFAVPGRCHAHGANLENHLRHETLRIKVAEFRQC